MEENHAFYWYTNFNKITFVTNEIEIAHYTDNEKFCVVHWYDFIMDLSMLIKLVDC